MGIHTVELNTEFQAILPKKLKKTKSKSKMPHGDSAKRACERQSHTFCKFHIHTVELNTEFQGKYLKYYNFIAKILSYFTGLLLQIDSPKWRLNNYLNVFSLLYFM